MAKRTITGLYPIIDTQYIDPKDILTVASHIIDGGAKTIQLRCKSLTPNVYLELAKELRKITLNNDVTLIINDRVDIAKLSNADGLHIGRTDIPVKEAREILGANKVIGTSSHSLEEAKESSLMDIDYLAFGPIFNTKSKKDANPVAGVKLLKEVTSLTDLPITAIGGITENNINELIDCKVNSISIISDILTSPNIKEKVSRLVSLF